MSPRVTTDDVIEHRLASHGLCLPDIAPTHEFLAVQIMERVAFVSGHAPYDQGEFRYQGVVGEDLSLEEAKAAARAALLGCLASVKACLGSLECVARILKMNGYVRCARDFTALAQVTNGASSLLVELWGVAGRHARTTVGVGSLPNGVAVELELVLELTERDFAPA